MSSLSLATVALHPAIPALAPGDRLFLESGCLTIPATVTVLRRIAAALKDGALQVLPDGPDWPEIEASVEAEWATLQTLIQTKMAEAQAARARGAA